MRHTLWACLLLSAFCFPCVTCGDHLELLRKAEQSIRAEDARKHIHTLASDAFEGRQAGARGGRASSIYLAQQFQKYKLLGSGSETSFFQEFGEMRNILGVIPGSDPELKSEYIIVGAHYDHVGYGSSQNSNGPTGFIHNGADDNASGTAAVLEIAEAWATGGVQPRRSILFALWDGEENGLLGSRHWVQNPTVPLAKVRCAINMDMVGRMRERKVEVTGTRSLAGLRRIAAECNAETKLELDFPWVVEENSDHWPFYERRIPFFMPFTGFHDDYHRPSDDVDKLNYEGVEQIARWMFLATHELAGIDRLPAFREAAYRETPAQQKQLETAPAPSSRWGGFLAVPDQGPGRLINQVLPNTPAAQAGLQAGQRVIRFADRTVETDSNLVGWLLRATGPVTLDVLFAGATSPQQVVLSLDKGPIRVGITWREDAAEPGVMIITRVEPGSPAEQAGLKFMDRVLTVKQEPIRDGEDFRALLLNAGTNFPVTVERKGQLQTLELQIDAE